MNKFFTLLIIFVLYSNAVVAGGNKVKKIRLEESAAKKLGFKVSRSTFLGRTSFRLKFPDKMETARWVQVTVSMHQNNEFVSSASQTAPNSENRIFYTYNSKLIDEVKVTVFYSDSRRYMITYEGSAT